MLEKKTLAAVLVATTFLTAGVAFAADQAMQPADQSKQQTTLDKDGMKLSKDGTKAYSDLALARLAIFDGRTKEAKTFVDEADAAFQKAGKDDTVFLKAEKDFKAPDSADGKTSGADKSATNDAESANAAKQEQSAKANDAATPKRWLPVDADMSVDEDLTANPKKAAAVADANKSLASGDKAGAREKLRVAEVDVVYVMAVVPLDQTLADVHQAAQLVDSGKFYEASQMLRQVQDSTRYDVLDASATPIKASAGKTDAAKPEAATH